MNLFRIDPEDSHRIGPRAFRDRNNACRGVKNPGCKCAVRLDLRPAMKLGHQPGGEIVQSSREQWASGHNPQQVGGVEDVAAGYTAVQHTRRHVIEEVKSCEPGSVGIHASRVKQLSGRGFQE